MKFSRELLTRASLVQPAEQQFGFFSGGNMPRKLCLMALVALAGISLGCASREERVADLRTQHPDWSAEDCDRLIDHTTWVGMTEAQLVWVIDREKILSRWYDSNSSQHDDDYGVQESPRLRVYTIMSYRDGTYRTWTVDKETGKVVDWYRSY